ncbi:MAG TPA: hypothetical protein VLZ74_07070 [Methylocella sp.]|nr:hypothetical protein [Methylocella sp.]
MSGKTINNRVAFAAGVLGVAGAVLLATASPSSAAPIAPNAAAVKTAVSNQITHVQYRGRGYGRGGYGRRYYGRGYYGRGYWGRGWGYPYGGYAYPYPYYYPYPYPYPYVGFGFGW